MLLLNLVAVLLPLLLGLVLGMWPVVPCGSKCACGTGSKLWADGFIPLFLLNPSQGWDERLLSRAPVLKRNQSNGLVNP